MTFLMRIKTGKRGRKGDDCVRCGGCCTGTVVPVTDSDVRRLKKKSGLSPDKFVRLYGTGETDYERDRDGWVHFSYGRRLMGIKRPRNERCFFLDETNHCTAYEARPMTCRSFPYMVNLYDDGSLDELKLNRVVGCSVPFGARISKRQLVKTARQEDAQDEAYYRKLNRWNRNGGGSKTEFLKFLKV